MSTVSTQSELSVMDVTSLKGAVIVIIFVITMVPQLIPLCLVRMRNGRLVFSARGQLVFDHLSCFAGGAFLGTCLLHLLAEGLEEFENYKQHVGLDLDFPLYQTIVGAGVFLIAFVEKLGHALQVKRSHSAAEGQAKDSVNGAVHTIAYKPFASEKAVTHVHKQMKVCGWVGQGHHNVVNDNEVGEQVSAEEANGESATPSRSHGVKVVNEVPEVERVAGLRAAVLMAALSFHTVFDGLAIGLQESVEDVWAVSTAISVHKALVAFCLGLELTSALRHASLRRPLVAMLVFSLVAPVGVGVGMIVTSSRLHETAELLTSSILQALATGTFLYVTFMEILAQHLSHLHAHDPEEGHGHGHGHDFLKIAVAAVGFGAMAGVKVMDKD